MGTVKRHKMQKVAELAQLTHMDKIHQQAKVGQTMACLACLPLNYALFKTQKILSANHADFSFNSLNTTFLRFLWPNYPVLGFFAPKTYFGLFAAKLGCSGIYVTKSNVLLFLLRNYAAFSFMSPKRCFRLFVAKFTLFSALSHWRLSFKALCN